MANKGITKLRKIQFGFEGAATPGTGVAATAIFRGEGRLKKVIEREQAPEHVGQLIPLPRKVTKFKQSELELSETHATYEQLPCLLAMAIDDVITGVADGVGSGYVYEYETANDDIPDPRTATFEVGNNQRAEEFAYGYIEELTLKGDANGIVMVSGKVRGTGAEETTFTSGINLLDVESIRFAAAKLYIDDSGTAVGTTQLSSTLLGWELSIKSPLAPAPSGDDDLGFGDLSCNEWEVSLKVTFRHNANADLELDDWEDDNKVRLLRLLIEGSDLATEGIYSKKTFQLDMAGVWGDFENDSKDGDEICTGTLELVDSPDDSLNFKATVVNEIASY